MDKKLNIQRSEYFLVGRPWLIVRCENSGLGDEGYGNRNEEVEATRTGGIEILSRRVF